MHRTVISKLLAYTLAMIVAPLSAYYLTLNHIYNGMQFTLNVQFTKCGGQRLILPMLHRSLHEGNNTFAGATAAVVANVVLIAYVIEALREDDADNKESKKNR